MTKVSKIKYVFFDCMETIIDLYELPSRSDYAYWAYLNSGVEAYWNSFDYFLKDYEAAKIYFDSILTVNEEYDMLDRIKYVVNQNDKIASELRPTIVERLYNTFWDTYQSKCYVQQDVSETLIRLSEKYRLAVISNFKVKNGIEKLLDINNLNHLFDFIITSIDFGWRKPDIKIYQHALNLSKCLSRDVVFVGDDYENDFLVPRQLGMNALLLIKNENDIGKDRISSFLDIEDKLTELSNRRS